MGEHSQKPKEACFEAAVTALQALRSSFGKGTPEIIHQREWTQAAKGRNKGKWRMEPTEWKWYYRFWPPMHDPNWPPGQNRYPDVTVVRADGKKVVIDTKFDRADGSRDTWGTTRGAVNGKTQREDYNEMNKQETGVSDLDLSLDADVCKCPPGKPKRVDDTNSAFAEEYAAPFVARGKERTDEQQPQDPAPPPPPPPRDRTEEEEEELEELDEEEAEDAPDDPIELPDYGIPVLPQPVVPGGIPGGVPVNPGMPLRPSPGIPWGLRGLAFP